MNENNIEFYEKMEKEASAFMFYYFSYCSIESNLLDDG